jgi:hypothetical protein
MVRVSRLLAPMAFALVLFGSACGGENPYQAAKNDAASVPAASTPTADTTQVGDNEFLPDRNLGDCVGTLERPNCGSAEKGTMGTYLTFAVLIAGLGFIFWRISVSVRRRDAVVNAPPVVTAPVVTAPVEVDAPKDTPSA